MWEGKTPSWEAWQGSGIRLLRCLHRFRKEVFMERLQKIISQADELKKRRVDIDDLEISDTASSHGAIGDAINVIKNNLQTFSGKAQILLTVHIWI